MKSTQPARIRKSGAAAKRRKESPRHEREARYAARQVRQGRDPGPLSQSPIASIPGRAGPPTFLAGPVRRRLETAFHADLSDLRIHHGPAAHSLATEAQANAFTAGRSLVFAAGAYRPYTGPGFELLAHETAHALQQTGQPMADGRLRLVSGPANTQQNVQRAPGDDDSDTVPPALQELTTGDNAWPTLVHIYATVAPFGDGAPYKADDLYKKEVAEMAQVIGGTLATFTDDANARTLAAWILKKRFRRFRAKCLALDALQISNQDDAALTFLQQDPRLETNFYSQSFRNKVSANFDQEFWATRFLDEEKSPYIRNIWNGMKTRLLDLALQPGRDLYAETPLAAEISYLNSLNNGGDELLLNPVQLETIFALGGLENAVLRSMNEQFKDDAIAVDLGFDIDESLKSSSYVKLAVRAYILNRIVNRPLETEPDPFYRRFREDLSETARNAYESARTAIDLAGTLISRLKRGVLYSGLQDLNTGKDVRLMRSAPFTAYLDGLAKEIALDATDSALALAPLQKALATGSAAADATAAAAPAAFRERMLTHAEFNRRRNRLMVEAILLAQTLDTAFEIAEPDKTTDDFSRPGPRTSMLMILIWSDWFGSWIKELVAKDNPDHVALQRYHLARALHGLGVVTRHRNLSKEAGTVAKASDAGESYAIIPMSHFEVDPRADYHDLPRESPVIADMWSGANGASRDKTPHYSELIIPTKTFVTFYDLAYLLAALPKLAKEITRQQTIAEENAKLPQGEERKLPPADSVKVLLDGVADSTPKPKRWISPDGVLVRNPRDNRLAIKVQDRHPAIDAWLGVGAAAASPHAPTPRWKGHTLVRAPNNWNAVYYWTLPPLDPVRERLKKVPEIQAILEAWRTGKNNIPEPAGAVEWMLQLYDWATVEGSVDAIRTAVGNHIEKELKEKEKEYAAQLRRLTTLNRTIRLDYIRDRLSLTPDTTEPKSRRDIAFDPGIVSDINDTVRQFQANVLPAEDRDIQTVALMIEAAPELLRVISVRTGYQHVQNFFEPVALALAMATGSVVFGVASDGDQKQIVDDPVARAARPKGEIRAGFATKMAALGVTEPELLTGLKNLRTILSRLDEARRANQSLFVLNGTVSEGLNTKLAQTRLKPGSDESKFILALPYRADVYETEGEGEWMPPMEVKSPLAQAAAARREMDADSDGTAAKPPKEKQFWEYNQIVYTDHPIFYNIEEVYTDFKYMPAYKASGAAHRAAQLTDHKGRPIPDNVDLIRLTVSRIYTKDGEPRFSPERTVIIQSGDHRLLELMTNVVDHQSRITQLNNLADLMQAGAELALDLLEFIPGVGQVIMLARLGANVLELIADLEWDELKNDLINSPQEMLELIQSDIIANLTGDAVWRFLLLGILDSSPASSKISASLSDAIARSKEKRNAQRAKQMTQRGSKRKSEKYKRFLNAVSGIGLRFGDAFLRAQRRVAVGVNSAQGNIAASPVVFKHLSRLPQYMVWVEMIADIVATAAELAASNPAGERDIAIRDRTQAQEDFAGGGMDFNKAITSMLSPLTTFELPEEVLPTDLMTEILIDLTIGRLARGNKKFRIVYEGLRLTGGIQLISREIAKRLVSGSAIDPNSYWKSDILPKIEEPVRTGRDQLVKDIYASLNALIPSAGLRPPALPDISVGKTAFSLDDPPEAEPFLYPGDPLYPAPLPRPEDRGMPLPATLRSRLQSGFGHDLSHVRLHRGREADDFVGGAGAEALTSGSHIYLRDGLNLMQGGGAHILRHEIAHVLQQTGAAPLGDDMRAGPAMGRPGKGLRHDLYREQAAERMARKAEHHASVEDGALPVEGTGERVLAPFSRTDMVKMLYKLTRKSQPTAFAESVAGANILTRGGKTAKTRATDLMADLRRILVSSETQRAGNMRYGQNALAEIKSYTDQYLARLDQTTIYRLASAAVFELPTAQQTSRNKYELSSQSFLNIIEGYLFSKIGVRLTIDADNRNPNKVNKVSIRGLHLGAIVANTNLFNTIKSSYTMVDGLEFDRARAYLRGRFPLPHKWQRGPDLKLDPDDQKTIAAAMKKESKLDPKDLPPWRSYSNPRSSDKVALRVSTHGSLTGNDAATERESHHLPQFLLLEYYTGISENKTVNIFGRDGSYWTPGFARGGTAESRRPRKKSVYTGFQSPNLTLDFAPFKAESNRGAGMPAVALAAVTHQKGGLHMNRERAWDEAKETKSPSSQGFTMINRHREFLIAAVKAQSALKKNDPTWGGTLETAAGFKAMVDEAEAGSDAQKAAIRNATGEALKKSYILFVNRMQQPLEQALIDHELPYYAGLATKHPDYEDKPNNPYMAPDSSQTGWVGTVISALKDQNRSSYGPWFTDGAWK